MGRRHGPRGQGLSQYVRLQPRRPMESSHLRQEHLQDDRIPTKVRDVLLYRPPGAVGFGLESFGRSRLVVIE